MLSMAFMRSTPHVFMVQPKRFMVPERELMKRDEGDYYADPMNVGERVVRIIALHDKIKNPAGVTPGSSLQELGINDLDLAEIMLLVDQEFNIEVPEDDCETFHTVDDIIENVCRNFYTH